MCWKSGRLSNAAENIVSNKSENTERRGRATTEHSLANLNSHPNVYLQTLRIVLYSETREKVVRPVIDSGSQRSYIRSEVASFLGYESRGNKEVVHTLFGGVNSKSKFKFAQNN